MKILFVNFGHASTPVSDVSAEVERVDVTVQLADPADPAEASAKAIDLASSVAEKLAEARRNGTAIVVGLPGASLAAVALVQALTGLLGFAPQVVVGTKRHGGFVYDLSRALDAGEVRDTARLFRGQYGL